jgi:phage gp36-like protein
MGASLMGYIHRLFRVVPLEQHNEILDRYCRLTAQYIAVKTRLDELTKDMLADPYIPSKDERKAMRDLVLGEGFNETSNGGD